MTHVVITSRLDCCCVLYVGQLLKMIPKSQMILNAAAHMLLLDKPRFHCLTPLLQELDWLLVVFQIQFKVLAITYKALKSLGSGYLKDHHSIQISAWPTQSSDGNFSWSHWLRRPDWWGSLQKPSQWWNSLRNEVCLASGLLFWRFLKIVLLKRAYLLDCCFITGFYAAFSSIFVCFIFL